MLVEGTITQVQGDKAVVSVKRASGCGRCNEAGGCGNGSGSCEAYSLRNLASASVGDVVEIDLPEGCAVKAAVLAYLLPLLGMFVGAAIGKVLSLSDLGLFAVCLAGGALCAWVGNVATQRGWIKLAAPCIVRVIQG